MRRMFSNKQIDNVIIEKAEQISLETLGSLFDSIKRTYPVHMTETTYEWSDVGIADGDTSRYADHELTEEELKNHMFEMTLNNGDAYSVTAQILFPEYINSQEAFYDYVIDGGTLILVQINGQGWDEPVMATVSIGTNLKLYYTAEDPEEFEWKGKFVFDASKDLSLADAEITLVGPCYFDYGSFNLAADNLNILFGSSTNRISQMYVKQLNIDNIKNNSGSKASLGDTVTEIVLPNNAIGSISLRNNDYTGVKVDKNSATLTNNYGKGIKVLNDGSLLVNGLPTSNPQVEGQLWNDNGVLKISAGE